MRLKAIYDIVDELAPFSLSREYCEKFGAHDNSGIILDCGGEITDILFSLDLSVASAAEAEKMGAQLVITHHPAIFFPVSSLRGGAVLSCAKAGISVLSAHLNLDAAKEGIDESLMRALGGKEADAVMHTLSAGAYGRVFGVEERPLPTFVREIRERFQTERVVVYGSRPVKRVASFCGAGMDEETLAFAADTGADTIVSSDGKHHLVAAAVERGMNVVLLTHYASENIGFAWFYRNFQEKMKGSGIRTEMFTDERLL